MASKMPSHVSGYDDERFEHIVSPSFHCIICKNVFKDPVMCHHNEHLFCRACITRHLMNSQTCPTCMEPLTVDTLTQAPRGIRNLLAELKIRCEFFARGCGKFVELGDLERHVADCVFAPAVCSNAGCQLEVNKQDLIHHQTAVCELRRVQCHSCNEMSEVKVYLAAMNGKLNNNEKALDRNEKKLDRNETNLKDVVAKVELVQEQLNKQEVSNCNVQGDIVEIKKTLNQITKQLERVTQRVSHEVQPEQEEMKKGIAEADEMDTEPKVVIAGGRNRGGRLNSAEMFSLSIQTWTPLQPMRECRSEACSVVYNNDVVVMGGCLPNTGATKSMERLSTNAVQADQSITWEKLTAELPRKLEGHCSVVYKGRLIVIGGYDADKDACSDSITEVSLVPPYTTKLLATMPQKWYHGVAIFGDKIVIVGGKKSAWNDSVLRSVVMYDITKNECNELAPLPYPVEDMATVKWRDDNVIIMGGADSNLEPLNKVLIYNIKSQKSNMLPDMKYKRRGCVAAVVRDTVIVLGGIDERGNYLKSAERFRFDYYTWDELPEMHEARCSATAVTC